ncbi:MAG: tetratricopeptide repeat protein [candidate division KSB1 bacterium]|nr:tetratricopeptide repeat protein [candidate division KSB1 bacterium]
MFRKLAFWLCIALLPIALFFLVEFSLRAFSFGYPTSFFQTVSTSKGRFIRDNPFFFYRFFPPKLARSTGRFIFPKHKAPDACRIFVFGSSAAMGDPDFSYSFSRILERMLAAGHPEKQFQVINTAATAVNSHVILPIVQECSKKQPDLFIVLMGNNEVIGPYGPGTILSPWQKNPRLIRLAVQISGTKWGQAAAAVRGLFKKSTEPQEWGGLELFLRHKFRHDDPALTTVYRSFAANLDHICDISAKAKVPLILCTVPTNLTDWAPFLSLPQELPKDLLGKKQTLLRQAEEAAKRGDPTQAASFYAQAAEIDSSDATVVYALAQVEREAGRIEKARRLFLRARDLDGLRFRADSRLNELIRRAAGQSRAILADLEMDFLNAQLQRERQDLFLDHVHFTFSGNYLLAGTLLPKVEAALGLQSSQPPTIEETARSLAYTGWDALRIQEEIARRFADPPFTAKSEYRELLTKVQNRIERLQIFKGPAALQSAESWYRTAVETFPQDWILCENYGKFLLNALGDASGAEKCFASALEILPQDALLSNNLGVAQSRQGRWQAAEQSFARACRLMPHLSDASANRLRALIELNRTDEAATLLLKSDLPQRKRAELFNSIGIRCINNGQQNRALNYFRAARQADPAFAEAFFNAALTLKALGDTTGALAELGRAVQLVPDQPAVRRELAKTLIAVGRYEDALAQYRDLVRLAPEDQEARNDLGVLYAQMGLFGEAMTEFNTVLSRDPKNAAALSNSAMTASLLRRHAEAIDRLKRLNRLGLRPEVLYRIGLEFLKMDRSDSARSYFRQAFELRPDYMPAVEKLDSLNQAEASAGR